MTGNKNQASTSKLNHYSPTKRQKTLDQLLAALREDQKIIGVLIVGSGSEGFDDNYSDIDLCVVIAQGQDVHPTFQEWGQKLKQLLPVFYCGQSVRGTNSYLWVLLLENFLEVNIGFLCLDDLQARKGRWKTVFDHSGQIEETMQRSWACRTEPNFQEMYDRYVCWLWYSVMHGTIAAQRGQMWRALYELEQIRNQTIELRGLRGGLGTKRFRHVDEISQEFLSDIRRTLVADLETSEIMRALQEATQCFLDEAKHLDKILGCDLAGRFEKKLKDYLELFE